MPNEKDFDAAIAPWCTKEGMTPKQFLPLRTLFLQYLRNDNQIAAQGILGCITSYDENVQALEAFLMDAEFFQNLSVKMHCINSELEPAYLVITKDFFEIAGLFTEINPLQTVLSCMQQMKRLPLLPGQIADGLTCAIMDVSNNLIYDFAEFPTPAFIQQLLADRMYWMVQFLESLATIPNLAENYVWQVTGSDPHSGGRQALFLQPVSASALPMVLKPRNMVAEQTLLSSMTVPSSILAWCNLLLPPELSLPTMVMYYAEGDSYGLEQRVTKLAVMSASSAQRFYQQMGCLAFITKLFGMSDLHQDNVMPVSGGPLILDGEVMLLMHCIRSRNLNSTQLFDAMNCFTNIFGEPAVSSFQLTENLSLAEINQAFWNGFNTIKHIFAAKGTDLLALFLNLLRKMPLIRILPFYTSDLAVNLISYRAGSKTVLANMITTLERKGREIGFTFDKYKMQAALKASYDKGDLPIFHIQVKLNMTSPLLVDGEIVGEMQQYLNQDFVERAFQDNFIWLCSLTQINMPFIQLQPQVQFPPAVAVKE